MKDPDAAPFLSLKNVPLWVCLFLCLALGVVGFSRHESRAGGAAADIN